MRIRIWHLATCFITACVATEVTDLHPSAFAADTASLIHMAPLEPSGDKIPLKVKIASVPNGCAWGDLDAIESELKSSKKPSLILSMEPLLDSDTSRKPIIHDISKFDLTKGFAVNFELPKATKPTHLALYICKDSEGKGRCAGKPLVPVQTVLNQYLVPMDPKTGKLKGEAKEVGEPKDKIYYFGYVLQNKGNIGVTKSKLLEGEYAKLETLLVSLGAQAGIAKSIKAKSDPIDSVQPMLTEKGVLSLYLPKLDKSQCPK